jgi:uncharacterized protein (TIGR02231 family)
LVQPAFNAGQEETIMVNRGVRTAVAVAVTLAWAGSALAQEGGRITRVTLYPGSATVERTAKVAPGQTRIDLTGLPANFDPRTLRIDADADIRIGEVSVRDVARTESLSGHESQLEAKIQALKDEKARLDVEVKTAELVRDFLASLSTRPDSENGKPHQVMVDPRTITATVEALRRGGVDAYGLIQRIDIRKRALDQQIAALERDLAQVRTGARDARTLQVSLHAPRAGEIRASYQVTNAGWKPAYRAALDSSTSRVELERQATITQRTGEDWRGVKLRLSTGQPRAAAIVDPAPWQITLKSQAEPRDTMSLRGIMAENKLPVLAEKPASAPAQASMVEFQTQYTTEFEVPGSVDLSADGRQVNVSLAKQSLPVKQRIRVVPRRDAAAMVTTESARPDGVWPAGDVQLYRDGSYIGSTFWNSQASEQLVLPFGRDDRVQVAVKRVKNRTGSAGIVNQRAERQVADLYTITSRHKLPVELLVLEASPVPVSDQVKVGAVFEPKPKIENWHEQRGVMAWEQSLKPGETAKFVADYTITYPRELAVLGLP